MPKIVKTHPSRHLKNVLKVIKDGMNGTAEDSSKKNHKSTHSSESNKSKSIFKASKKISRKLPKPLRQLLKFFTNPFVVYGLIIALVLTILGLMYLLRDLPSPRKLTSSENFSVSTLIYDRHGKILYEIFADERRTPINIDDLPPHVLQATVAIEDQRFYQHFGFDIIGITRALTNNLQGKPIEGGSTITQQLVKNALLSPEQTITRKAKEAVLAVFTEVLYSKKQILEMYLNYISYGGTAVGIESAANHYFDKHASELTLAEAALLAGLPQAPSRFSPFGSNPQAADNRQAEVLKRMADDGYITKEEADAARDQVLTYALDKTDIKAPHFVFYVRDFLYEKYGVEKVEHGGLRVTTTLDLDIQNMAQASVSAEIENLARYRVGNGAAMVTKPNTGEILAMVGSRDYFDTEGDGQVNVTIAERQPGSSIKPIMYAIGMQEKVLNPGTILLDIPTCFEVPGQKSYCPKNYDGSFKGPVTVRQALGSSLNIPAVKGLKAIGLEKFIEIATNMGITTWKDPSNYGLSLTLGGGEIRMIDMAQAFGVLANEGIKVPLTPILKIEDYQGEILEELDLEERLDDLAYLTDFDDDSFGDLERVMDRAPAYLTAHIMQDNNARIPAFGPRSELVIPNQVVSAKTGTTNDLKDNWTVGFTPEILTITWVGNNDGTPMNPYLVSGVTGAAPIWNDIMTQLLTGRDPVWPQKPFEVSSAGVCASGFPPGNLGSAQESNSDKDGEDKSDPTNCPVRYDELYWMKGQPSDSRVDKKETWIKGETGLPPAPGDEEGLVLEEHTFYQDPVTDYFCYDCRWPVAEDGTIQYSNSFVQAAPENNN